MKRNVISILFLAGLMAGCSQQNNTITPKDLSSQHIGQVSQLIKSPIAKGNSWKGNWAFTILNKDRQLKEGIVVNKAKFNAKINEIKPGERISASSIPADSVVYVGFTSLEDESHGYDIITNYQNQKMPLSDIKVNGNNLEWSIKYKADTKSKSPFHDDMLYATKAQYDPTRDILQGQTTFGMNFKYIDGSQADKPKEKEKFIPMGSYNWQASRISTTDFQALTAAGKNSEKVPQYLIGIDTRNPAIEKILYH